MPMMTAAQLAAFSASAGSISKITLREATGDRSVTLDRHDKSVLFSRIPDGSFARKGGALPNGNPDHHAFLVLPRNAFSGAQAKDVPVVHPKRRGNELRLYGSAGTGLDLKAGEYFYIFVRTGELRPYIGTISAKSLTALSKSAPATKGLVASAASIDDEEEDAAYQRAIGNTAAKLPVGFKGVRYPRDPTIALKALKKAKFLCEAAPAGVQHGTFESAASGQPYVEAHHLIPLSKQEDFEGNLDVMENIVALCPTCHRRLHHSKPDQRIETLRALHKERQAGLVRKGIEIDEAQLLEAYGISTGDLLKHFNAS
ncbi:MAG: HNH endonuclease [Erythrobacter sp.]